MPRTNTRVNYIPDPYNNITQSKFEILDENGNKYIYEAVGGNASTSNCTTGFQLSLTNYSFYLTKIKTYYGQEVNFYYTTQSFTYEMPQSQSEYQNMSTTCSECLGNSIESSSCVNNYISNRKTT